MQIEALEYIAMRQLSQLTPENKHKVFKFVHELMGSQMKSSSALSEGLTDEMEKLLAALLPAQRRAIERYFGVVSETSIQEEIQIQIKLHGCHSEDSLNDLLQKGGTEQTVRSLAIAELMGH